MLWTSIPTDTTSPLRATIMLMRPTMKQSLTPIMHDKQNIIISLGTTQGNIIHVSIMNAENFLEEGSFFEGLRAMLHKADLSLVPDCQHQNLSAYFLATSVRCHSG